MTLSKSPDLTIVELKICERLRREAGRIVSRHEMSLSVFGKNFLESNAIDVHIKNIRRKLGAEAIFTVRGVGYRAGEKLLQSPSFEN